MADGPALLCELPIFAHARAQIGYVGINLRNRLFHCPPPRYLMSKHAPRFVNNSKYDSGASGETGSARRRNDCGESAMGVSVTGAPIHFRLTATGDDLGCALHPAVGATTRAGARGGTTVRA